MVTLSPVNAVPLGFVDEDVGRVVNGAGANMVPNRKTGGHMLVVANKAGSLYAFEEPDTSSDTTLILDMQDRVCDDGERGLQGIIAHPNFEENQWIYMFYTAKQDGQGCSLLDSINGPRNRLSRVKVNSDNMVDLSTEEILMTTIPLTEKIHNGGAMAFGSDGNLYVTLGDGGGRSDNYSQQLHMLLGKIIRITPDGGIPDGNPFTSETGYTSARCSETGIVPDGSSDETVCEEIYAYGFRNPFRFAMDTNRQDKVRFFVNDVGGAKWEEVSEGGSDFAGANYGWPMREGPCALGSVDDCEYPGDQLEDPIYYYQHTDEGGAVVGGTFIPTEAGWPEIFQDSYLFNEFIFGEIVLITPTGVTCREDCDPPVPQWENQTFAEWPRPTDIFFGPYQDGWALYYTGRKGSQNVRRIRYVGGENRSPEAYASANVTSGVNPLVVKFDASGSVDPDGDTITIEWDFENVADVSTSTEAVVTFDEPGVYVVTLTVRDELMYYNTAFLEISVGTPPVATIESPPDNATFAVGDVFMLQGEAFDSNGESLTASSIFWEVRQHHSTHYHPYLGLTSGNNFALSAAPEPEDFIAATNSYLEVLMYAIDDATGLETVVSRKIQPRKLFVEFDTEPSGLQLLIGDFPVTTPTTIVSWENQNLRVEAQDQGSFVFQRWSDTGERKHAILMPTSDPTTSQDLGPLNFVVRFVLNETATPSEVPSVDPTSPATAPPSEGPSVDPTSSPATAPPSESISVDPTSSLATATSPTTISPSVMNARTTEAPSVVETSQQGSTSSACRAVVTLPFGFLVLCAVIVLVAPFLL
jgi:glucose/arabinose dehydrogenase/PKD repeat protein